jgi:hypothetical protein
MTDADVLYAEPQFGDGREENHKAHADTTEEWVGGMLFVKRRLPI